MEGNLLLWLELGLGLGDHLLNRGLFLWRLDLLGSACNPGVKTALLAGGHILVNSTFLGSLVERRGKALVESRHLFNARIKSGAELFLLCLETAQDTRVAGFALDALTLPLEFGAALFDCCFAGCHRKGGGCLVGTMNNRMVPVAGFEPATKGL